MIKQNFIGHYLSPSGIRITLADATEAVQKASEVHQLSPLGETILGKVMLSAAMLASDFKNREGVSIKWDTHTALGAIHSDAYESGCIRGFLDHPDAIRDLMYSEPLGKQYIGDQGDLFVTRYSLLRRPYVSSIHLKTGTVSDCINQYFRESDQTLSHTEIQTKFSADGTVLRLSGFIAQLLPGGDRNLFEKVFSSDITYDLYSENEADPLSLNHLIGSMQFVLLAEYPLTFQCTCGEDKIKNSLLGLPSCEKENLLEDPFIEVHCHYCGKTYKISRETLKEWFADKKEEIAHE